MKYIQKFTITYLDQIIIKYNTISGKTENALVDKKELSCCNHQNTEMEQSNSLSALVQAFLNRLQSQFEWVII